ncbi:hypothetical protein CTEN210_14773 [Chaetoceros tenuissimus]|uniref:Uncharacterized protein n=1 Tax=Chaetoceros tenuissimus TaxID=426638 RepID=A0AAD3D6C5_9STRA|nr:hypothetical protein CTEN210_14773 [Chaetoceros tenuissimus]
MSSLFGDFIPTAPGKQPAKVRGGRDNDDDDDNILVNDLGALCCGKIGNNGNVFCGALSSKGCPSSHENKVSVLVARKVTGAAVLYYMTRSSAKIKLSVDLMLDVADLDTVEIEGLLQTNFRDHGDWIHEVESRNEALLRNVPLAQARSTVKKPSVFNKMEDDEEKPAAIKPEGEGWLSLVDKRIVEWMGAADQKLKEEINDLTTKYQMLLTQVGSPSVRLARAGQSIWEAIEDTSAPDLMKAVQDPSKLKDLQEAVFHNQGFRHYLKTTKDAVESITDRVSKLELANANRTASSSTGTSLFDSFRVGGSEMEPVSPMEDPDEIVRFALNNSSTFRLSNGTHPSSPFIYLNNAMVSSFEKAQIMRFRNLFQFDMDNPKCCNPQISPYANETVFHFRNFKREMPQGFTEMGANETYTELFSDAKIGDNVAIITRFDNDEETKNIANVLKSNGLRVRIISGQSGEQDFCFLLKSKQKIVGSTRSTFFIWAGLLGNSSLVHSYAIGNQIQGLNMTGFMNKTFITTRHGIDKKL